MITADMLRARKNLNLDMNSFEVPAELLVGLDEEEWEGGEDEEEVSAKKGKAKAKPKKAAKPEARPKAKKRRRTFGNEEEGYF